MDPSAAPHRFWEIFFEVFGALPRQGPGNRVSAQRAFAHCTGLPPRPQVLDLGCGSGAQTLYLAEFTDGPILALDNHAPGIECLQATLRERGLEQRVRAVVGDMATPGLPEASLDLIWSEGALYSIGLPAALTVCHRLLRSRGYLVFTDAVWRMEQPPAEVKASFDFDYPGMGSVADDMATIRSAGLEIIDHFTLPDEAWWEDFYTPMETRIETLRQHYAGDAEALGILDQVAAEPAMHRTHSACYAYEYFITRKP